jgi:L-fuconolactonase
MIDAHVHIWDLAVRDQAWIPAGSPIRRTFSLTSLRETIASSPVQQVILVQAINDAGETADLLRAAAGAGDLVAGVIGWADLADPDLPEQLETLSCAGPLAGVRHQALAEPQAGNWLGSRPIQPGLEKLAAAGLPFDLMIRPQHFGAAAAVARRHPSLQLVLDHLGKPDIAGGQLSSWAAGLASLAGEPNISCKLSGVQTVAQPGWTYADLEPFLDVALSVFGPDRMMFGSDWPVCAQAASYDQVVAVAAAACAALAPAERAAVLGGTARRIYRCPAGIARTSAFPYYEHNESTSGELS